MAIRVNPKLIDELEVYGAQDVQKCYHCGNCSAVCPFSKEPYIFPRRPMRFLQMGLEEKLKGSLEPWLCYYCGECSEECPRGAEPGETMMSLRRWLTSKYDFTGISRLFYRSGKIELAAVIGAALLTGLGFVLWGMSQGSINHYDGPNAFLPSSSIHIFDWILAGVLLVLLLTNCARMWWFTMGRDKTFNIPTSLYIKKLYALPLHFFTQKRYAKCERKRPWAIHLALMLSYVIMLVLIMFFLACDAGRARPSTGGCTSFGYLATVGLLGTTHLRDPGTGEEVRAALRSTRTRPTGSSWSCWCLSRSPASCSIFSTGVGIDVAANVTYVVHLMGVVPMLGLEVPFSKWSHLAYRPLGMYFSPVESRGHRPGPRRGSGARNGDSTCGRGDVMEQHKIGVYVCNCGTNIAKVVDCEAVVRAAAEQPGVVVAKSYKYMCSNPGQEMIVEDIQAQGLDRVVVAACSPRMHEPTFRKALQGAGINPYFLGDGQHTRAVQLGAR